MTPLTESDLEGILRVHVEPTRVSTHGETCHLWDRHRNCAIVRLVDEVRRLRAELNTAMGKNASFSFFVPGIPVAQPRARVTKVRAYTPNNGVIGWKSTILGLAKRNGAVGFAKPHESVAVYLLFAVPKRVTDKPDLDNLTKPVLDALTSAGVWHDDSQVVLLRVSKCRAAGDAVGLRLSVEKRVELVEGQAETKADPQA